MWMSVHNDFKDKNLKKIRSPEKSRDSRETDSLWSSFSAACAPCTHFVELVLGFANPYQIKEHTYHDLFKLTAITVREHGLAHTLETTNP